MRTIETSLRPGPDHVLRLEIPVDSGDRIYRLVVVIDDDPGSIPGAAWPEGFIDATAGAWVGELQRVPEGGCDPRQSL